MMQCYLSKKVSYSKAIDYFLMTSLGFIFMSLLEYILVLNTDPRFWTERRRQQKSEKMKSLYKVSDTFNTFSLWCSELIAEIVTTLILSRNQRISCATSRYDFYGCSLLALYSFCEKIQLQIFKLTAIIRNYPKALELRNFSQMIISLLAAVRYFRLCSFLCYSNFCCS